MSVLSLTFRDLQYLVALAEHKHFSKAAKACFVSQPALSSQIKKIEGYFGKSFFERHNRQVILTQEGAFVVEKAREILQQAQMLDSLFKDNKNILSHTLNIGIIHTLSHYYPTYFMNHLLLKYPHCSIEFREGYTEELITNLKSGKIDVLVGSEGFYDEKLVTFPLFKEPLYIAVNKNHPFALQKSISLSELNAEEMIFLKEGNCLRNESIDLCPKNKRGNIKEYHLSSLEALKYTVALNKSYAIIPKMATKLDDTLKNLLVIKPIQDSQAYRQISLYARKQGVRQQDVQAFVNVLKESNVTSPLESRFATS